MEKRKPIAIDLFSGAGGLSQGLEMAGFDIPVGVENSIDAYFVYTYNHRRTLVLREDIRKIKTFRYILNKMRLNKKDIDLVAGGPPCQGFSIANTKTRNPENGNNKLVNEFIRVVDEISPKAFLMENVMGIASFDGGKFLEQTLSQFDSLGYSLKVLRLNAAEYGVPQNRKRIFIIGTTSNNFKAPNPTHGKNGKKPFVTVEDAILGDLPPLGNGVVGEPVMEYAGEPNSLYQKRIRGTCGRVYDHVTTRNSKKVIERMAHIGPGESLHDLIDRGELPQELVIKVDHKSVYRRLDPTKPSVTVANYRKAMLIHPTDNRLLTVREAARLQSFPDNYRFTARYATNGLISHMQQLVGNAVPPLLAKAVGMQLKRVIKKG